MAQGRRGASAWINGEMLEQGETIAGRTVRIEPLVVRLQQAGQPTSCCVLASKAPRQNRLCKTLFPRIIS